MPATPSPSNSGSDGRLAPPYAGSGIADPANIIILDKARFTVLGDGLLRLEWAADAKFEDRPSFFAVRRNLGAQNFQRWDDKGQLQLQTKRLRLLYKPDGKSFHAGNLSISVLPADGGQAVEWKPGQAQTGNLGGSLRTLDECEGPLPLGEGVLSRDGWFLRDDSKTVLYTDEAEPWVAPRRATGDLDWYFFGYGSDLQAALRDFVSIGGDVPLPPKFTLGSWYSRYWPYTDKEFLEIADDYQAKGFPLDVMVLDMDWHKDGWTGYSWNKDLLPDPEGLLKKLKERGLRTTLNLHPHDGVQKQEDAYEAFAKAMGHDASKGERVPFDVSSKDFVANYFKLLLNPLEEQGVDFWWMDWQQGTDTKIPGLDPLMWLNHLHFRDRQRPQPAGALRGLSFSRWAGWGDHRHPVHFSGDTHANWEVLDFLSAFSAVAGNVGVGFWSHDLGGHFSSGGRIDPELYLRWIQFGALSPVMRVHSTRDVNNDRRPWLYSEEFTQAAREAYRLRAELVPYLYTASRQAFDSGLPLLRPMYLHYPKAEAAYHSPSQFMVGEDLIMAPAARAGFGAQKVAHVRVWLPEGTWYLWQTHERFVGPLETLVPVPLDGVALFARGGAPIPLNTPGARQACESNGPLRVRVYPGPAAARELYQDDGETRGYQNGAYRRTLLSTAPGDKDAMVLTLGPSVGSFAGAANERPAMQVESPFWSKPLADAMVPAAPLDQAARVSFEPVADPALAELLQAVLSLGVRIRLSAGQLLGQSRHAEAATLAEEIEAFLAKDQSRETHAAVRRQATDFQLRSEKLLGALIELGAEAEPALRVLAGVSFYAQILPGSKSGSYRVEFELRRDAAAVQATVGSVQARWKMQHSPLGQQAEFQARRDCISTFYGPLELDRQALAQWAGSAELELNLGGRRIILRESLLWNGTGVKDWAVLGPVNADLKLDASTLDGSAFSAEHAGPQGPQAWSQQSFDPSRVARGLRHFYAWGDLIKCPDAAAFAATVIEAAKPGQAVLHFHWEGSSELWLNGVSLSKPGVSAYTVDLKAGANLVLIRVANCTASHKALYLSVDEGSPAQGLSFHAPQSRTAALSSKQL